MFKHIIIIIIIIGFTNKIVAQYSFSHELGVIAGPILFQSDYGERNDLKTNVGNSGMGIGIVHYINFSFAANCNCYTPESYFNDHFKLRSELSYNKLNFDHLGEWVKPSRTSIYADMLRAMKGTTSLTNIGMQLEYFPLSIRNFTSKDGSLAPFVSLGAQFSYYNAKAYSSLGSLGTTLTTYPKYLTPTDNRPYGFSTEGSSVWSIVSSLGVRYKLTPLRDLMIDLRFQYFFSDWVDGLKPNPNLYKENKANDWLVWFNFGYIYYL